MLTFRRLLICSTLAIAAVGVTPSVAHADQPNEHTDVYAPTTGETYQPEEDVQLLDIDLECAGYDRFHLIWTYYRNGGGPGSIADLHCGTSNWGLRHIEQRHESDWAYYASITGASWEDLADFAIEQTLAAPSDVYYRSSNDTWSFRAPLQVRDIFGNVIVEYVARVVVADNSQNIITAFPE